MTHTQFEQRVRQAVAAELTDRASFKKNGHSWTQYLGKLITPERVLLLLMAAFTFGGRVQQYERDLAQALAESQRAVKDLSAVRLEMLSTAEAVQKQAATLAQVQATAGKVDVMTRRLDLAITRTEFQAAMRQQILPRLERIEHTLGSKP